jgi:hypothetical protein
MKMDNGDIVKYVGKGFIGFDKKDTSMRICEIKKFDFVVDYKGCEMLVRKSEVEELQEKKINYLLRDIPKELWDKAKHKAVDNNLSSLRELLLLAIKEYIK